MVTTSDQRVIEELQERVYCYVFTLLDSQPDLDCDDAAKAAGRASNAVAALLAKCWEVDR